MKYQKRYLESNPVVAERVREQDRLKKNELWRTSRAFRSRVKAYRKTEAYCKIKSAAQARYAAANKAKIAATRRARYLRTGK